MTVVLAVIALSAAQARIGQTSDQVIQDAGREKAGSVQWVENLGRPMLRVQYHDDVILHLFGSDGREIAFYYYATKALKPEDVDNIQRMYHTTWRGMGNDGGVFSWGSVNGLYMAAERLETCDYLAIFDMTRKQEIPETRSAIPIAALASTPAPMLAPAPTTGPIVPQQPYYSPPPASSPAIASTAADQNDCLVVATEAYARLKKSSHWAEIAGFTWIEDEKKIGGHAVVFYQPTEKTNVFMYDRSGSYDLQTRSHDLGEIIAALNQLTRDNLRVESPRWLETDDSREEFASSKSDRQPNWSSTAPTTTEQTAEEITIVFLGILTWILMLAVSVICFLKGKPVFGTLGLFSGALSWWAIVGAIRIAKPGSWWARKYYGPEKMEIAHRRFTPQKVQETKPVIIDDPVERALERVKRNNPTVVSQPDEAGTRPGRIKTLAKAIASVVGTLILWIGIIFSYTYFLIACLVFLTLWRGEYFSLVISGLIAIGLCIILRYFTGAIGTRRHCTARSGFGRQ